MVGMVVRDSGFNGLRRGQLSAVPRMQGKADTNVSLFEELITDKVGCSDSEEDALMRSARKPSFGRRVKGGSRKKNLPYDFRFSHHHSFWVELSPSLYTQILLHLSFIELILFGPFHTLPTQQLRTSHRSHQHVFHAQRRPAAATPRAGPARRAREMGYPRKAQGWLPPARFL